MKSARFSALVAALAFVVLGCNKAKGPVVAQVGSVKVTLDELQGRLRDMSPSYQQFVVSPEGRKQFLQAILREKTVLAEAEKSDIPGSSTYKGSLDAFKANQARQLNEYKDTLLVESYLRKLRAKDLAVTDAEVQKYYDDHRDQYEHPMEVIASHILVSTPEEADAVVARLKKGEAFEKIAREVSKDPSSAARGGQLQPFKHGTLVPEFEDAAFALKVGGVSGIVKTQFGFHIIKKLGARALPARPYTDVKEDIRRQLERSKFDQWVAQKQTELGAHIDETTAAMLSLPATPNLPPQEKAQ